MGGGYELATRSIRCVKQNKSITPTTSPPETSGPTPCFARIGSTELPVFAGSFGRRKRELILRDIEHYKPAVTKTILLFLAGIAWVSVGILLLSLAFSWLSFVPDINVFPYSGAGILLALLVHHFGFLRVADKNLKRILQMDGKRCLFSFISWKSYLIILAMITMGFILRHSMIPKKDLAILYIGIGLALVLSSIRYIRAFYREMFRQRVV